MSAEQGNKSSAGEVFNEELNVLAEAETFSKRDDVSPRELTEKYKFLAKKYKSLLKQAIKITKIGDSTQSKLIKTQQELDRHNEELAQKNRILIEKNDALVRAHEALLQAKQREQTMFSALAEALPGTVLDDKYRLDQKIGVGGYGAVFRSTHLTLNRSVAIKVLQPKSGLITPDDLERFRREGISACRITHPNAVAVSDFGISSSGIAYLVMELLTGQTLTEEMRRAGRVSPARSAQILIPVCQALAEAHSAGIVHRDIKPDNIFLHQSQAGEIVKVLDFGLAKLLGVEGQQSDMPELTQGVIVGTPFYMPPERLSNLPYDGKADIYSLGIVFHQMLTGRLPFQLRKANMGALVMAHLMEQPASLLKLVPELPEDLDALVLRMLRKVPGERPTALETAKALHQFL